MPKLAGVNHLQAVRAFTKAGYEVTRQSGHIVMRKGESILIIPRNNPIKPHTMGSLIQAAGLSIEGFKKLLK